MSRAKKIRLFVILIYAITYTMSFGVVYLVAYLSNETIPNYAWYIIFALSSHEARKQVKDQLKKVG